MDIESARKTAELLNLSMSEERLEKLYPTYEDWMQRAELLDQKMSPYGLNAPAAANIFKH